MKLKTLALIVAFTAPAWAGPDTDKDKDKPADKTNGKLSDVEVQTLAHLHKVNQFEIEMGKMAEKQGTAAVKTYGTTLVADHQKSDKEIMALAKKKGVSLTTGPASDADAQEMKDMEADRDHMKTMKGKDFDKEFLAMMIAGHTKELARVDTAIAGATDSDMQTLLKNTRPVLEKHIDQARTIQKKMEAQASK